MYVEKHSKNSKQVLINACRAGSIQKTELSKHVKECLCTATELSPHDHIEMTAALVGAGGAIDETALKTVNLAKNATMDDVFNTFVFAHKKELKNISVYRDRSYENQPYKLSK